MSDVARGDRTGLDDPWTGPVSENFVDLGPDRFEAYRIRVQVRFFGSCTH